MKTFVRILSPLKCDKNTNILLAHKQKRKQTNKQSKPSVTQTGPSQAQVSLKPSQVSSLEQQIRFF